MVTDVGVPRPSRFAAVPAPSAVAPGCWPSLRVFVGERKVGLAPKVFLRPGLPFYVRVGDELPSKASCWVAPARRSGLPSMKSGLSSP